MDIEGTYTLQATPEQVWQSLMSHKVLLHAVPGVEQFKQVGQDTYEITLQIKQDPLAGTYHGQAAITDLQYPEHYRILVEGEGRESKIKGSGDIFLQARTDNTTTIMYHGTLHTDKHDSWLPPQVVKGAAKLLIQNFFTAVADQLRVASEPGTTEGTESSALKQPPADSAISPVLNEKISVVSPVSHTIVRLLRLGGGDPMQEARWMGRVRRIGVASLLLFLVWLGTRLPRRR